MPEIFIPITFGKTSFKNHIISYWVIFMMHIKIYVFILRFMNKRGKS